MSLYEPNETQAAVAQAARAYAQRSLAPDAARLDREHQFPAQHLLALAELGMMGVNVPAALGGAEAGAVAYALSIMEIAQGCASTAVTTAVNNMVAECIVKFGSEAQAQKYVPEITSGRFQAGAFGLSEPHCGSDAAALKTTARKDGSTFVLNGSKQWITSGDHAGVIIVWARTDAAVAPAKGISCFLVEQGASGLHIGKHERKMGLRASTTVSLAFDDLRVPAEAMLGQPGQGFQIAMTALAGGRIGIASQAIGIGQAALDAAVRYAKERKAFGKAIGEHQALRFMLADCDTRLSAAKLLTLRAAALKEQGVPYVREGSMAKVFASEVANQLCDVAVQVHGGYGYIDEFPVERHYRDARVTTIYEGTSEVQRLVIARDVLQ
jgi:acyl-CoA dehydrogenase